MYIEYTKTSIKQIKAQDQPTRNRLKKAIHEIPHGDIKKLRGHSEVYRLRVGGLRVIYSVSNNIVTIRQVLPRGEAYNNL